MVVSMNVKGMERVQEALNSMDERMVNAVHTFLQEWGLYAYNATQEACPVDTGLLAESGSLNVMEDRVAIVYAAPYARFVEFGWQRTAPITPKSRKALRWEPDRVGRLGAQAQKGGSIDPRFVFATKVVKPAQFEGISFVRVPVKRALKFMDAFWEQAVEQEVRQGAS